MNALWQTPVVVLVVLAWFAQPPQTLADAAKREALRRQATPASKAVLSNLGQPPEVPLSAVMPPPPDPDVDPEKTTEQKADPAKEEVKKDEQWWRKRITTARDELAQAERSVATLESRINALQRDVVNFDDPVRRGKAREELQAARADQDKARLAADAARRKIDEIQEEARRERVPPGWIR